MRVRVPVCTPAHPYPIMPS